MLCYVMYDIPFDAATSEAATGATISDADKTDGIPNYMLRTSSYMSSQPLCSEQRSQTPSLRAAPKA